MEKKDACLNNRNSTLTERNCAIFNSLLMLLNVICIMSSCAVDMCFVCDFLTLVFICAFYLHFYFV